MKAKVNGACKSKLKSKRRLFVTSTPKGNNLSKSKSNSKMRIKLLKRSRKRKQSMVGTKTKYLTHNVLEINNSSSVAQEISIKRIRKLLGDETIDNVPDYDDDANFLQDLDLLVLGSSATEYRRYTQLLRKEYSHLDDASYVQMRLKVIQTFLMIPTIFSTKEFQSQFEETARTNIKNEIDELQK